ELTVLTSKLEHPSLTSVLKTGTKLPSTQIVFTMVSVPHLFPVFMVTVYVPGSVKFKHKLSLPEIHKLESLEPKSLPKEPLVMLYPTEGDILHIMFGLISQEVPAPLFSSPKDRFSKHICVFTHATSGASNAASGAIDTYIGTTPTEEVLQGLDATMLAENEF